MNNSVYLILIAVLAILAVVMLYSRFVARSREKSSHHAPAMILFSAETISAAPMEAREPVSASADEVDAVLISQEKTGNVEKEPAERPRVEESRNSESDYLDELQEAAAGLALLMRSSPIGRVAPVIFAPETLSDAAEAKGVTDPLVEPVLEKIDDAAAECGLPQAGVIGETVIQLRHVIGAAAVEIVERIDLELDALERLVSSIENSLVQLGAPDDRERMESTDHEVEVRVSEAA